ncbi:MAG TPA: hypothetical protein VM223_13405 [Planctomycetota bacterium]|nr:hypothetical protein [Planctomycetota bacterium]
MRKIYIASSWRCPHYRKVLEAVRSAGFDCYDFQNTKSAFNWSQIDPEWRDWNVREYINGLDHPLAMRGFESDFRALQEADACVLVLPCGRSAHLELGWCTGVGKFTMILILDGATEPELMYRAAHRICRTIGEVVLTLQDWESSTIIKADKA